MSKQYNHCFMTRGNYNLCDPSEESCQLVFRLTEEAKQAYAEILGGNRRTICGFTFKPDYESEVVTDEGPFAAAKSLLEMVESRYLYWSDKKHVEALTQALEATDTADRLGAIQNQIGRLEKDLTRAVSERDAILSEMEADQ